MPSLKQSFSTSGLGQGGLKTAEWMAENAYIPPGMHRLLAAGGLAVGLWGGRSLMDVVTARHSSDGSEMTRKEVPQLFRPLHGVLRYNPYSDAPSDRWKGVVDKFVPAITGAMMSYYGGKHFFHGKGWSLLDKAEKPLHPLTASVKSGTAPMSSQALEQLGSMHQADAMRKLAAGTYGAGATIGTDKLGGVFPGNHNNWANSFAIGAGIKPRFPETNIPGVRAGLRWINQRVLGNHSSMSVSPTRVMNAAAKWVEGNLHTHRPLEEWATPERLTQWAKDALQHFPHATEQQIGDVAKHLRGVIDDAHAMMPKAGEALSPDTQKAIYQRITGNGSTPGFSYQGFDRLLDNVGIDLGKVQPSQHGFMSTVARGLGAAKHEAGPRKAYAEYLEKGNFKNASTFDASAPELSARQKLTLWGGIAGATTAVVGAGSMAAHAINKRAARIDEDGTVVTSNYDTPVAQNRATAKKGNLLDGFNGTPLNMMEWASRMVIVPPSMHRLMSAGYLSAALYGGMKLADAMTGRKLPLLRSGAMFNSEVTKESLTGLLRPLRAVHGILHYTPGSDGIADRWRQAAHYLIPVAFGAVGTYTGSASFFKDRLKNMEAPKTIEDFTDKIAMEQSKPFAALTAVTSIFNTGSGIHLVPFFNYSSNLQSRYVLGSGLQVATPGLGKWWSGNAGLTPWGIKKTLGYISNYLAHNPEQRPRELPALVHSVLAKLYPDMPEGELLVKKRNFLHALHEVRDTYFVNGDVPKDLQADMKTHMKALVTGEGFEHLLVVSGFDPLKADLASNGVSGTIANAMGQKKDVARLTDAYHQQFEQRMAAEGESPSEFLRKLANSPSTPAQPSANDNAAQHAQPGTKISAGSVAHAERLEQHPREAAAGRNA
ncbi:MAG: hypothetical protein DI582_05805 [Azospirillum brasilense]|nr:MAG: hypothetical protein DI582_05805 [Azospirillum brasilense]